MCPSRVDLVVRRVEGASEGEEGCGRGRGGGALKEGVWARNWARTGGACRFRWVRSVSGCEVEKEGEAPEGFGRGGCSVEKIVVERV
jgi:hypothetical protein